MCFWNAHQGSHTSWKIIEIQEKLFQDNGIIIEFQEKLLKFVKMEKSCKNHWILVQSFMETSQNSEIDIALTYYMCG